MSHSPSPTSVAPANWITSQSPSPPDPIAATLAPFSTPRPPPRPAGPCRDPAPSRPTFPRPPAPPRPAVVATTPHDRRPTISFNTKPSRAGRRVRPSLSLSLSATVSPSRQVRRVLHLRPCQQRQSMNTGTGTGAHQLRGRANSPPASDGSKTERSTRTASTARVARGPRPGRSARSIPSPSATMPPAQAPSASGRQGEPPTGRAHARPRSPALGHRLPFPSSQCERNSEAERPSAHRRERPAPRPVPRYARLRREMK